MLSIFDPYLCHRQPLACLLFESALKRDCLGHAYLLVGSATEDKWLLSKQLASFLNCTADNKLALGSCYQQPNGSTVCQNCQWIVNNQHPAAWISLTGEDTKTGKIGVASARLLAEELSKTSPFIRVVVIPHASEDSFHRPAANALLKTIEEPSPKCLFLLFARYPEEVIPTIVSRCQTIPTSSKDISPQQSTIEDTDQAQVATIRQTLDKLGEPQCSVGTSYRQRNLAKLSLALESSEELTRLAQSRLSGQSVLDVLIKLEVERLRIFACEDKAKCLYLSKLLTLSETAKNQMENHVPVRTVIESFLLAFSQLQS